MNEKLGMRNEGWRKIELSDVFEISKNKFNPKTTNKNEKCIELEHISQGTGKLLGYTNSSEQQSIKNIFKKNQVLFGKLRPYLKKYWKADFEGVCSTEIWVLDGKSITNDFLFQFIQTEKFNQVANVSSGSKMPRADWKYMAEIPFNIPPLKEQQKIAQILSTWDDAISKQEELIVAKERLKKGLMQRWIISDQWEMIKLDEILYEHKNKSNGKEEVYSVSVHKGLVNQIKHLGRSYSAKDTSNYNLVSPHDIVYTKSPTGDFPYGIIKENKTNKEVIVSPLYGVFSPKNKYVACILDAYFISYIRTNNYLRPLIQKGAKNTMSISNSTFLSRSIKFPKTEQEQQKIAQILTTADKEIELLKSELTAFKEQKRGLMQRLLTGEVRVKI
ncbi:MAG: restriction endonuclease subunit S [Sulfurovum sp.]|nr:restriction endonuclease subunit S [Sulfurovum sp.]